MYDLLKGLRVVEGAAFIAGPSCGLYLAQMGAEVIRFDQIGGGPDAGRWPLAPNGASLYWEGLNKGKKSVAIDLSRPEGRELAVRIATAGDGLFVTNYPAAGFLSHAKLAAARADVICLRVMGWPDERPAVDYTVNASAGVPMMTGPADDPRPVNHVLPAWDLLAGAHAAFSLLAAERDRRTSGKGREIRLSLADLAAGTLGNLGQVAEVLLAGGQDRPKSGNDLFGAFGRDFVSQDGQRLMIVAITPRQWKSLVEVLGLAEAIAPIEAALGVNFTKDEGARFTHRAAIFPLFEAAIARRTAAELGPLFDEKGVCWSVYETLSGALRNQPILFSDNPIFSEVAHPGGTYPTPGAFARLPQDERRPAPAAPRIGDHTDEVLASLLSMSDGEIAALHDKGIVA
jgi:2-methylfumaryl-CoA isomerase